MKKFLLLLLFSSCSAIYLPSERGTLAIIKKKKNINRGIATYIMSGILNDKLYKVDDFDTFKVGDTVRVYAGDIGPFIKHVE